MVQRVLRQEVRKPAWTVQFEHATGLSVFERFEGCDRSCGRISNPFCVFASAADVQMDSLSFSEGKGKYSDGVVERSAIVFAIE